MPQKIYQSLHLLRKLWTIKFKSWETSSNMVQLSYRLVIWNIYKLQQGIDSFFLHKSRTMTLFLTGSRNHLTPGLLCWGMLVCWRGGKNLLGQRARDPLCHDRVCSQNPPNKKSEPSYSGEIEGAAHQPVFRRSAFCFSLFELPWRACDWQDTHKVKQNKFRTEPKSAFLA